MITFVMKGEAQKPVGHQQMMFVDHVMKKKCLQNVAALSSLEFDSKKYEATVSEN